MKLYHGTQIQNIKLLEPFATKGNAISKVLEYLKVLTFLSKEEIESVNEKLHELTPEELEQVTGGWIAAIADGKFASVAEGKSGDNGFRSVR